MGINNYDVIEEQVLELVPASTAQLNSGRLGPNSAIGGGQVVYRPSHGFGADSIIAGIDIAASDHCVVRVLYVNPIVVGRVEVAFYRHILDQSSIAPAQVYATNKIWFA